MAYNEKDKEKEKDKYQINEIGVDMDSSMLEEVKK